MRATAYEVMTTCAPSMVSSTPPGLVARAVDDDRAQRRREPRGLALPRRQHRRRSHDEHGVREPRPARAPAAPSRASAASCPGPCRRPARRRARCPTAATATGTRRAGRGAAWRRAPRARDAGSTESRSSSAPTACDHLALCCSTTPSAASSSHSPAWTTEIRRGSVGLSCSERASSTSARSDSSSGRSSENHVPLSRIRCSCPRARASMSGPAARPRRPRSPRCRGRTSRSGRRRRHPTSTPG